MEEFKQLYGKIKQRFPNAKFSVSCFKTIDEIENKILCDADEIIYADDYIVDGKTLRDFFVIKKKQNQEHIYYHDVIDVLIEKDFIRNDCNHRYLERIGEASENRNRRNQNSVKLYGSFWGS